MPLFFAHLTRSELDALPRSRTVFFLPVAGLEDHGPHLPVGLDLSIASALAEATAHRLEATERTERWIGVLLPPAPLSAESNTDVLRLKTRATVLRDWLLDTAQSLRKRGFLHFACVSGTLGPRQLAAIEDAGRAFRRWNNGLFLLRWRAPDQLVTFSSLSSAHLKPGTVRSSPFWADPEEHGGMEDVSLALALNRNAGKAPEIQRPPMVPAPESRFERLLLRLQRKREGYWGSDPAQGSHEAGNRHLQAWAEKSTSLLLDVLEKGSDPDKTFRSGYSYFLPNHPLFIGWVWSIGMSIGILLWISFSVQLMLSR
jgi:creatinine amidohydrolase/Fe(II)-dependent formamide hydrolase-like protein